MKHRFKVTNILMDGQFEYIYRDLEKHRIYLNISSND